MRFLTLRFILASLLVLQLAGCELNIGGGRGHRAGFGAEHGGGYSEHRGGHD